MSTRPERNRDRSKLVLALQETVPNFVPDAICQGRVSNVVEIVEERAPGT